ncbi:hypothetical protein F4054_23940 [Candidatus Poribacteria bacterium]|nr:hypothetical protein [Candidatus Poribacteria bacterium]
MDNRIDQEKIIGEIELKPVDRSMSEILPPGHEFESMFTANDLSYTVRVCFVDLQSVMRGINHSYSESDTLIKYSKAKYSPVSPESAKHIRLATPSYYANLEVAEHSELIRDDLEGAYVEHDNSGNRGSVGMEAIRDRLSGSPLSLGNSNVSLELTWGRNDFWMYCTSIAHKGTRQRQSLSSDYDFITKIESPSEFAKQLGRDVGKHISLHNNLTCSYPGFHTITTVMKREILEKQGGFFGEHLIFVNHGTVIYLDEDRIQELMINIPNLEAGGIIPFVKREQYKNQQEYRFVVSVQWHSPPEDILDIQVSDDLRKLMSPIEGSRY